MNYFKSNEIFDRNIYSKNLDANVLHDSNAIKRILTLKTEMIKQDDTHINLLKALEESACRSGLISVISTRDSHCIIKRYIFKK